MLGVRRRSRRDLPEKLGRRCSEAPPRKKKAFGVVAAPKASIDARTVGTPSRVVRGGPGLRRAGFHNDGGGFAIGGENDNAPLIAGSPLRLDRVGMLALFDGQDVPQFGAHA